MQIFLYIRTVCAAALSKYYSQPVFDKRTFERRIMELNAIILAGGEGTRLKSVTGDLPKPMVQLCGKPVLEHILALLKRNGVTDACMALHYRPEVIR